MTLPAEATTGTFLGWLWSLLAAFFIWSFMLLISPNFPGSPCNFGFRLTASFTVLSQAHCLAFQIFWNLDESLHDPISPAFYMSVKPELHGWCQGLWSAGAVAMLTWIKASEASVYILWLSTVNKIPGNLFPRHHSGGMVSWGLLLKWKLYNFAPLSQWWWGLSDISHALKLSFLLYKVLEFFM